MKVLELFSGTHSVGKVAKQLGYEVVSLDRDLGPECLFGSGYKSDKHIQADIMTWDYKKYQPGEFDLITASPVCLWWSKLRNSWIGRRAKTIHPTDIITKEHIEADIENYGKPMVNKVFEIIEYFQPKHWWIENPQTGRMKEYIASAFPQYNTYYDIDYCKYSDWGYKKRTRFWTNIEGFEAKVCANDCANMEAGQHKKVLANGYEIINGEKILCNTKALRDMMRQLKKIKPEAFQGGGHKLNKFDKYRIPENLIKELMEIIT